MADHSVSNRVMLNVDDNAASGSVTTTVDGKEYRYVIPSTPVTTSDDGSSAAPSKPFYKSWVFWILVIAVVGAAGWYYMERKGGAKEIKSGLSRMSDSIKKSASSFSNKLSSLRSSPSSTLSPAISIK